VEASDSVTGAASPSPANPIRELLADRNYRNFWIAQVLIFGMNGTVRFAFVWLMVTLTDWSAAEGLIGIAYGLPALLLSLPAGAWSDRVDRRRFFIVWSAAAAVAFAAFAVVIAADLANPVAAGIAAVIIGSLLVVLSPNMNAIVPLLVPPERLVNAVALQNGGGQAAGFLGLALGGLLIEWVGNAGSFAMMAVLCGAACLLMVPVRIPDTADAPVAAPGEGDTNNTSVAATEASTSKLRAEVADGLRYGMGAEPRRTLLILALILGSSFSVMQIAMPRVVEEDFGRDSGAAGLLLGTFGLGMLLSSMVVARRSASMRHGLNVARFIGIGLGMGQFLLSLAPGYWVATAIMVAWGINAGVAIASHRTLLQQHTEPAMMGRVMGIMTLGFAGGLPFGALTQALLAPAIGPVMTMRVVGLVTMAITIPLTWRRIIRSA
jgi:MFS family permease